MSKKKLRDEDLAEIENKRNQKIFDDYNNPQDPNTLETTLKKNKIKGFNPSKSMLDEEFEDQIKTPKRHELDPKSSTTEGVGSQIRKATFQVAESGDLLDELNPAAGAIITTGANILDVFMSPDEFGNLHFDKPRLMDILPKISNIINNSGPRLLKEQKDLPLDKTKALIPPRSQTNMVRNFYGGNITSEGIEFLKRMVLGGPGSGRKPTPKPDPNQKDIFQSAREDPSLGQSNEAINEQYQALYKKYDDRTLGDTIDEGLTNKQKREKYSRKLNSTDLDLIIQEEGLKGNTIPPEKAQEYVDLVNETRLGKKDRNNPSGRLRRNQKGYIGTMVYLNEVSLGTNPNTLGNTADIIKHISKEMGTDAIGLKRIIEGQGGEISFQTEGMKTPKKIRSLKELVEAYHLRLSRYKEIPAFEKGHVFAANNIIEDRDINSLTDFKNNLEPEISRSIREQLDDEAIEELIKAKGKVKGDDFYRSVLDGNRKRQNTQDPDKILADLLGTQYGLRESFLTFVNPERSLSNIIPEESKALFAELYRKELLAEIKGFKADLRINKGQSSIGPASIDKLKLDVARSVAQEMKNNKILEEIIVMDDMISKREMTEQGQAKPLPDESIKKDPDGLIRGDTPD